MPKSLERKRKTFKNLELGWPPTHQNWCRVLSVFKVKKFWCRFLTVFVGFLSVFLSDFCRFSQNIFNAKNYQILWKFSTKRLYIIHKLGQSVDHQSLSGQRHNSASVNFIREDFFGKVSYRIIDLKLCSSRRAFETLQLMIDHKLGRWGAKSVFWSYLSHLNSIILHMRMTLWLNKQGFLLFIRVQKFSIFKNHKIVPNKSKFGPALWKIPV